MTDIAHLSNKLMCMKLHI